MADTDTPIDPRRLGELVRQVCVDAALAGYEDASLSGLCHEGAWEAAVSAIRRVDLDGIVVASGTTAEPAMTRVTADGPLRELTGSLARQFASPGPPGAGSAAAASGAIAAGLLEGVATCSEERGSERFRERAHAIRRRAAVLQSSLASAGQEDAETLGALLRAQPGGVPPEARRRATASWLEIGARCAQAVTLAAEVAVHGPDAIRPDVDAALRLACSASECALDLAEDNLRPEADEEWARNAKRRAWRARLLLQRATALLQDDASP